MASRRYHATYGSFFQSSLNVLPARSQEVHEVLVQGNLLNIRPTSVLRTPEMADWIGGSGEGAPEGHREGFATGKGPVVGEILVAYLKYEYYGQAIPYQGHNRVKCQTKPNQYHLFTMSILKADLDPVVATRIAFQLGAHKGKRAVLGRTIGQSCT